MTVPGSAGRRITACRWKPASRPPTPGRKQENRPAGFPLFLPPVLGDINTGFRILGQLEKLLPGPAAGVPGGLVHHEDNLPNPVTDGRPLCAIAPLPRQASPFSSLPPTGNLRNLPFSG